MATKKYLDLSGLTYFWSKINAKLATKADSSAVPTVVTSISSSSTDAQVPSAKCVYTAIGDVETILQTLNNGGGAQ